MLDFLSALCLILVIEGALYALFPEAMMRMMAQVLRLPASSLRTAGALAAGVGLVFLWLVRG
ncbi:MAG: DUF2065 domain-containing protein [Alphaproteobacteria bacterium]